MSRRITRRTLRKMILAEMRQIIREDDGGGINPEVRTFIEDAYPQFAGALFAMADKNSQVGPYLNELYDKGEEMLEAYIDAMVKIWAATNKLKNKTQNLALKTIDPLNLRSFFLD